MRSLVQLLLMRIHIGVIPGRRNVSEKCLEEMNARKQEIYLRKPSSGMTSGKVFPETNPAVCAQFR